MSNPNLSQKLIWINGVQLPAPDKGLKEQRQQLVDSGRNAEGQVIAQLINRRLLKLDSLQWSYLTATQWGAILNEIEKFEGVLKYWDARTNGFLEIKVYWGNAEAEPNDVDASGRILNYKNCKCNVIDMGY